MVVKLNCRKSEVVGGITGITRTMNNITDITRYRSPEEKQALFFNKLLAKLHEVTLSK